MATDAGGSALRQFLLEGLLDMERTIGNGSFATVKELSFHGLKCVGKKLHEVLLKTATPQQRVAILERFAEECKLLSKLHHSCIVQFLGVYFEQGSHAQLPVLVMEYLHTTLSTCIDEYGILPEEISYGILRDVALGLRYLHEHSPTIIHRDLSANNILLTTDMSAKISDLGVAKILNLSPAQMGQMTQTQTPGTPCYMPPEAMVARPKYTSKVDIFSYGVMMVHILSGQWPLPGDVFKADPNNPDLITPVSEMDRRSEYIQEVDNDHPLMELVRQCLKNAPASRPEASQLLRHVETVISHLPPTFTNKIDAIKQIQAKPGGSNVELLVKEMENLKGDVQAKIQESKKQRSEIESQARSIEALTEENQQLKEENDILRGQLEDLSMGQPNPKPFLLQLHDKLQWTKCANLPIEMTGLQSVLVGEKVYAGGGDTDGINECYLMFQYDLERGGRWVLLPRSPVMWCGLGEFLGHLITIGGCDHEGRVTGKLHRYLEDRQEWEEYLKPMPTARYVLSVITTESAIIACGGSDTKNENLKIVEVYTVETSQWHTADSLPVSCIDMGAVTIADTCYLLGGDGESDKAMKTVLCAPVSSLIKKATSSHWRLSKVFKNSLWKTLPDAQLRSFTPVVLCGRILALGGIQDDSGNSPAIHMFLPSADSWVRMTGSDLPVAVYRHAAIELPNNRLLLCGGSDDNTVKLKDVYIGSISSE